AGLGFAGFFIFLAAAPDDAGTWLLVPARMASVAVVLGLAAVARVPMRLPAGSRIPVAFVGLAEVVA
ncbi:MAG: EamA/RhaT family transporter, partial [Actinobacteria bacterium]|nr:EamA/RhaT family transporter [Gemmatimonadota bacterium]NIR37933.1 EamA/RhaT family transporter [Actinomycetota bacterium]NIU75515.1 EamA/RhaT family transporter [Gammaproteobacteria bacterium]NIU19776.1 EamA/RhaT family transporter [Actinomycetota bacterium]NIV56250.1 EamA/RhaT family transporter [Actinomycetota bacterium]